MNLARVLQQVVPPVQEYKRKSLERPGGETTMFPALLALRDGRVVCIVTAPRMVTVLRCLTTVAVGLAPQSLVLAAQVSLPERAATDEVPAQEPGEGIAYTTMSRQREAAFAVQRYQVEGGQVRYAAPVPGTPQDRSVMEALAAAMAQRPLHPGQVSRKQGANAADSSGGAADRAANPAFLPAPQGRLVLDAGTVRSLRTKLTEAGGGTVFFVASSPEHATRLVAHGMDRAALLT